MADDRTYIRVHDGMDEHPKIEPLSDAAFRLLLRSWFYCSRNRTDGRMPDAIWKKRGTAKTRAELLAAGLAEQCEGYVEMHDYLEHQRSAEEIRLLKEHRGDTGTLGNHIRWHVVRRKPKDDCEHCQNDPGSDRKRIANAIANGSQTDRKPIASTEAETEAEISTSVRGASHVSSAAPSAPPRFPDHCQRHANEAEPGKCGECADVRKARQVRPALSLVSDRPDWCGECHEWTRLRDYDGTPYRCPTCHPLAEESA
jgi:hypothetical protein